ncbi:RNA-binding protein [Dongia deserti]|uniref:RNA-binding protein n=1 Tax=Dongia deserti TaxID=2268030 RepID=UPI002547FA14|nr:RNA-binding protein [Dongia deserti]
MTTAMVDELDAGTTGENLTSPTLRRCIVTRQALEKPAMIRFVIDPEGRVTPDLKERLPGRGMWVTATREALDQAVAKHAFSKAAKQSVKAAPDLADRVADLARREVAELLGLARKSGQLVAGFEKVEAALRAGKVRVLVAASDGAEDGRGKLARLAGSGVEICAPLTAAELAQALGREHAVHAAIKAGGIAEKTIIASRRSAALEPSWRPWAENGARAE